ncbi:hypothetical protein HNR46_003505 [Haloferula luteola]|uniref:Uncharacterized protein n=1 Tax=Haloferula luteola TaxID=595692 RepID=A0A840VHD4_9BACT|nr:hypothetical protein [Haloferula luteola]
MISRWSKGVGIALRIYGAGIMTSLALLPLYFLPEHSAWPLSLLGVAYFIIVAPYAFYRGLGACGLAVRILDQGPVNSATKRKNEELRCEAEARSDKGA